MAIQHKQPKGKEGASRFYINPECECDVCLLERTFEDSGAAPAAPPTPNDKERGLYGKYNIERSDGKPMPSAGMYMVLRYDAQQFFEGKTAQAEAAMRALNVYAQEIEKDYPAFAGDLKRELANQASTLDHLVNYRKNLEGLNNG